MTTRAIEDDIATAGRWAGFYRARGYNPLPTDPETGHPPVAYRQWWCDPAPADLFDRHAFPSLQVMTGRRWGLIVIDLDGDEAKSRWAGMGRSPRTWTVVSGGGGMHLWFRISPDYPREIVKAVVWRGEGSHSLIERFGDRGLITAPPSLHRKTGRRYRFIDKARSPASMPLPAPCPEWILRLESVDRKPVPTAEVFVCRRAAPIATDGSARYRKEDVLAAIGDKVGLARSWGLRVTTKRSGPDCLACHAIGRPDAHPSGIFNVETGVYWDAWIGKGMSLLDVGVSLGIYADWRDALADLGARYVARRAG